MDESTLAAIRQRHATVEQAQLDLVRELALQHAYRDSFPDIMRLVRTWQEAAERMEELAETASLWSRQRITARAETYRSLSRQLFMELHGLTEEDLHETALPPR